MQITNFAEAHKALEGYLSSRTARREAPTLEPMQKLLAFLGDPQQTYKVVHVAGTSGKTSTAYYTSAFLHAGGGKVGLTVSPHTVAINDRVQINGQPLPEPVFCAELEVFLDHIIKSGVQPTYFELMVAFAFWEFARQHVDYAVVEVGIGGLWDSTNTIARADKIAIITDIGFDHTAVLGHTLPEIAAQKAGIIQHRNTVFMYDQASEILHQIRVRARKKQADLHILTSKDDIAVDERLPLFQKRNSRLALAGAQFALSRDGFRPLSDDAITEALQISIPGRMETCIVGSKTVILDGAHNGQKMNALAESIRALYPDKRIACLLALLENRESELRMREVLSVAGDLAETCVVTQFSGPEDGPYHGVPVGDIMQVANELNIPSVIPIVAPEKALQEILERDNDIVVVAGSIYLLNHIRSLVLKAAA